MSYYAPVLIITLNRFEHFVRCVNSLAKCTNAERTDLFIALDYPFKETHWAGYKKIEEFLDEIYGFKSVNIIKRSINFGPIKNFLDAQSQIFELYDRIIFSEDDNEFSPNFLDYINKGLDKFDNYENVLAVCGYCFPLEYPKDYKFNYYFYQRYSAWGTGTWKKKFPAEIEWNYNKLYEFMKNKKYANILKSQAERHYFRVLDCIKDKETIYGDEILILICIIKNQYCVYPIESKVRNHGHDGTGIHGGLLFNNPYIKQIIDCKKDFEFDENVPLIDKDLNQSYSSTLKLSRKEHIMRLLRKSKIGDYLIKIFVKLKRKYNAKINSIPKKEM